MSDLSVSSLIALPERHSGAARLSVFFALWTLALLVMHDVRVNAAPIYDSAPAGNAKWLAAPTPPPTFDAASTWDAIAQRSDVMSGRWGGSARKETKPAQSAARVAEKQAMQPAPDVVVSKQDAAPIVKSASDVADAEMRVAQRIFSGDFAGAMALIDQTRAENPRAAPQLRVLDARVAIGQGSYEHAYSMLLDGLPDIHISTKQHDLLAAVMVRTSRYAEAAAVYRALLTLDSTNTRWWAGYAVTQEKLGRHSELIGAYRTLRTLAPPGTPLAAWAGDQLQRIG